MQKFLIIGLGNIGEEYAETRHNIGFKVADELAKTLKATWEVNKLAAYSSATYKGKQIHIIKPSTYMNLSGKAMHYWMQNLKIPKENCIVIVDDLAIDFAKLRIKTKGSAGGHNGLISIEETLHTQDYPRIRCGIGSDFHKGKQVEYVLGRWKPTEQQELPFFTQNTVDAIFSIIFEGYPLAMTKFNK